MGEIILQSEVPRGGPGGGGLPAGLREMLAQGGGPGAHSGMDRALLISMLGEEQRRQAAGMISRPILYALKAVFDSFCPFWETFPADVCSPFGCIWDQAVRCDLVFSS